MTNTADSQTEGTGTMATSLNSERPYGFIATDPDDGRKVFYSYTKRAMRDRAAARMARVGWIITKTDPS